MQRKQEFYLQTQKITCTCYFQILLKNSSLKMVKGKLWLPHSSRKGTGVFKCGKSLKKRKRKHFRWFDINQITQLLLTSKIYPWKEAENPLLLQKI